MAKEDKKEPISDLTKHNLKREEEVRAATKRLDEYLVSKFDLNKPKSVKGVSEEKIQKNSEVKESEQTAKNAESKNDKKAQEKESKTKVTEK